MSSIHPSGSFRAMHDILKEDMTMKVVGSFALAAVFGAAAGCNTSPSLTMRVNKLEGEVEKVNVELQEIATELERFTEGGGIAAGTCRELTVQVRDDLAYPGAARYTITMRPHGTHIYGASYDVYSMPISPTPGADDAVITSMEEGVFQCSTGWAYFFGSCPHGKTTKVTAVGAGTKYVLRIVGTTHWVYLLSGTAGNSVELTSPTGAQRTLTLPNPSNNQFLDVTYGVSGSVRDLDTDPDDTHKTFIEATVKPRVIAAGIQW